MEKNNDFFNDDLLIVPTSVVEISSQNFRNVGGHDSDSSRGGFSAFPWEAGQMAVELFLRGKRLVFDPFAGWGHRGKICAENNVKYIGFDVSKNAIDSADLCFGVKNIIADSRIAEIPSFDGMLTCPPYWNLEKYHSNLSLDRAKTWDIFVSELSGIFSRCFNAANNSAVFCIFVGNWRKDRIYYDMEHETCKIMYSLGAEIVDKVVFSRRKISKIKIMLPQCKRHGYSVNVHETLLVFRKR